MTEKHYGGASSHGMKDKASSSNSKTDINLKTDKSKALDNSEESDDSQLTSKDIETLKKVGKIATETIKYAKSFIKKGMPLLEIAEKIESKIIELGGKPAFPCNLSINEIAAHYTPSYNDTEIAQGLLKVDLGVHINGLVADTAFSLDLENSTENKKLIEAAELALNEATKKINNAIEISQIGEVIEKSIKSLGFQPIQNLSGHAIERYDLHAGINIPNYNNSSPIKITPGVYAIEPFSTVGLGKVRDGRPSGIYQIQKSGNVRDNFAREVLSFIDEEYSTLPFCSRWIHKKFGTRGLVALRQIEQAGILHHYSQLIEIGKGKVAQAEHTIVITEKDKIITTL